MNKFIVVKICLLILLVVLVAGNLWAGWDIMLHRSAALLDFCRTFDWSLCSTFPHHPRHQPLAPAVPGLPDAVPGRLQVAVQPDRPDRGPLKGRVSHHQRLLLPGDRGGEWWRTTAHSGTSHISGKWKISLQGENLRLKFLAGNQLYDWQTHRLLTLMMRSKKALQFSAINSDFWA